TSSLREVKGWNGGSSILRNQRITGSRSDSTEITVSVGIELFRFAVVVRHFHFGGTWKFGQYGKILTAPCHLKWPVHSSKSRVVS
ncbi:hypothetical protein AVEN_97095-1, partial [Araneus ventricosus]